MEQTSKPKDINWNDIGQGNLFYKFEPGKRVVLGIADWKLTMVEAQDFNDKTKMTWQPEFYAKVVAEAEPQAENAKKCDKVIRTLSKSLMASLKPHLQSLKTDQTAFLSIKRIGEGQKTAYDVELVKPLQIV